MRKWIKRFAVATALFLGLAWIYYTINNAGTISVKYIESPNRDHQNIRHSLLAWRGFDRAAAQLDSTYVLPQDIEIRFADCGQENAFFNPGPNRITLCYELVTALIRDYGPLTRSDSALSIAVLRTTFFVFYHEFGHALVHVLDLPVTGREEDVVDQLATLVLLHGGEEGLDAALQGADWFRLNAGNGNRTPYWDEHGLDAQRYFNIICWIYGSNPSQYQGLLGPQWALPAERAGRCPAEYQQMAGAWDRLLAFHTE
jgi:hypothetical protein